MEARNSNTNGSVTDEQDLATTDSDEFTATAVVAEEEFDADIESSDNVGMSSVQFDVEDLILELEAESSDGVDGNGRLRKRLDAILERKRRHEALQDFDDYDLDS